MSYTYLQEQGEVSSAECFSDIRQSALSRLKNTQEKSCCKDSVTGSCHGSRSGTTLPRSMDDRGVDWLTLSRADFLVRTYRQQARAQGLTDSVLACGGKWPVSLTKYDRDTYSWKTHQYLLLGGLEEFSETWPRWGMMRDGECWALSMQVPRTSETGSGLWPTPIKSTGGPSKNPDNSRGLHAGNPLATAVAHKQMFPPPTTQDNVQLKGNPDHPKRGTTLGGAARFWPTPKASPSGPDFARANREKSGGDDLATAVVKKEMWLTPTVACANVGQMTRGGKRKGELLLGGAVRAWPTPRTKGMCGGTGAWEQLKSSCETLDEARKMGAGNGGQLNPTWVAWLMGWPLEWTALKPLGMDKFRQWLRSHGGSYQEKSND